MQEKVLTDYQEALDKIKTELSDKRTELNTLLNQTIENLNTSIPKMRNEAKLLQEEIVRLTKVVEEKKNESNKEKESFQSHYNNLEILLKQEYAKRMITLDEIERKNAIRDAEYTLSINNLRKLELELNKEKEEIALSSNNLIQDRNAFESHKTVELHNIDTLKAERQRLLDEAKLIQEHSKNQLEEIKLKSKELKKSLSESEQVKLRIVEAQSILKEAKELEENTKNREIKLNEMHVKIMADGRKIALKTEELEAKEALLNQRENNLQLAEANLTKG